MFNNWYNNGVTLGNFNNINLVGGLLGSTGANNTININNFNSYVGAGTSGPGGQSSGPILWNGPQQIVLGAMGATTIGATSPAFITINNYNTLGKNYSYYQVSTVVVCTGANASGTQFMMQQRLGATGGLSSSGTPIAQSVVISNHIIVPSGFGWSGTANQMQLANDYVVAIPSGTNISTWIIPTYGGSLAQVGYLQTGTYFNIELIG